MFKTLVNAWKVADLRKKILFTVAILVIYRFGNAVPIPFINAEALSQLFMDNGENVLYGYLNLLTGGSFTSCTVFALSITPYITASIIVQLLTMAIPALERMIKEGGEEGRKKQAKIMRYAAVALGLIEGFVYYLTLYRNNIIAEGVFVAEGGTFDTILVGAIIVMTFAAGTAVVMWLGELINDHGIGNGISMILFAGIVSRLPVSIGSIWNFIAGGNKLNVGNLIIAVVLLLVSVVLVGFVVWVTNAERRITVQYAKRVVGRKIYGGQSSYIPMKVNMTGVMPIIFASSIVSIPAMIAGFFNAPAEGSFWDVFLDIVNAPSPVYIVLYFLLIIAFSFFYAYAQFNPIEIANNMKQNGGFIPGLRPGRPSAAYISRVLKNVTVLGAVFLGLVAVLPIIVSAFSAELSNMALGGTTLLIVVGVALETVNQLETQLVMRHYKGFLN
ncbi:MAG: preprotein translocase subunit SecY [Ruminococcaceae bacterium]|nr:preprotein translocase subunit SecY [Oscillospiraceae bacterium]